MPRPRPRSRRERNLLVHSVWDQAVDQEFLDLLREKGTLYSPTLSVPRGYLEVRKAAFGKRAPVLDDPNGCVDAATLARVAETAGLEMPSETAESLAGREKQMVEREAIGAANLKRVAAAGVPIALGTDAGNPLTLHGPAVYAELEAMQAAGMAPMEVLVAATRGGAKAMGREKDLGTVEAGKQADLLVLDSDPTADVSAFRRLTHVVRGGVVRPIAELKAGPSPQPSPR